MRLVKSGELWPIRNSSRHHRTSVSGLSGCFQVKDVLRVVPGTMVAAYGHVGDGDLHFNPISPHFSPKVSLIY